MPNAMRQTTIAVSYRTVKEIKFLPKIPDVKIAKQIQREIIKFRDEDSHFYSRFARTLIRLRYFHELSAVC